LITKEVAKQIANATGPAGAPGSPGSPGAPGSPGTNGTARAYVKVIPHASFPCTAGVGGNECQTAFSKGVSRVTRFSTGGYCVTAPGIDSASVAAAVTVEWGTSGDPEGNASAMTRTSAANCGAGEFEVHTERQPNIAVDEGGGVDNATAVGPA